MITGWMALFRRGLAFVRRRGRPQTPQLTSLENPEKYLPRNPSKRRQFFSVFIPETQKTPLKISYPLNIAADSTELGNLERRPTYERMTSDAALLEPERQKYQSFFETSSSAGSRPITPLQTVDKLQSSSTLNQFSTRPLSQIQPGFSTDRVPRSYTPMREAPLPPSRTSTVTSASINIKYSPSVAKPRTPGGSNVSDAPPKQHTMYKKLIRSR